MSLTRCRASLRTSALITSLVLGGVVMLPTPTAFAATAQAAPAARPPQSPEQQKQQKQQKQQLAKLAAAFHDARCKFDPLLFATANGDSRYNDQIGLSISP
ncbi:MAG TPA: hypothetical protein VF670_00585, partial [Duganella sp.]